MRGLKWFAAWLLAMAAMPAAPATSAQAVQGPTAAEIVAKNAAARGGVDGWRKLQTMAWAGHVESSRAGGRPLPFLLEQKRPDRTRFEILAEGQRSLRVYDGAHGWKLRPKTGGPPELTSFSDDELRFAHGAPVIDGPLMDFVARRALITVEGIGEAEGRRAYVLSVALPTGDRHRLWIDAQTYLELRHDREVRGGLRSTTVTVLFRNYQEFQGLQIPLTIETVGAHGAGTNKLVIERVALNPELDDSQFTPPTQHFSRRRGAVVDTRSAAVSMPSQRTP
jgi:outer membrane lipoprotein-sorting protein